MIFVPSVIGTCAHLQVSEIVYVHSKCMIVDDRVTIIGSGTMAGVCGVSHYTILCPASHETVLYSTPLFYCPPDKLNILHSYGLSWLGFCSTVPQ